MRGRTNGSGPYTVGGDPKGRTLPTIGCAISLAITLTEQAGGENQRGVFKDGERVARVERHGDRSTTVEEVRA